MEYTGPVSELKEMCEIRIEVAGTRHKSDLARDLEHQLTMARIQKKLPIYGKLKFNVRTIYRYSYMGICDARVDVKCLKFVESVQAKYKSRGN